MAGSRRKDRIVSLLPIDASVLMPDVDVNSHSGHKELDSCCYYTMKLKVCGEYCSNNSLKSKVMAVCLNLTVQ